MMCAHSLACMHSPSQKRPRLQDGVNTTHSCYGGGKASGSAPHGPSSLFCWPYGHRGWEASLCPPGRTISRSTDARCLHLRPDGSGLLGRSAWGTNSTQASAAPWVSSTRLSAGASQPCPSELQISTCGSWW